MYQNVFLLFDLMDYDTLLTDLITDADFINLYEILSLDGSYDLEDDDLYDDSDDEDFSCCEDGDETDEEDEEAEENFYS